MFVGDVVGGVFGVGIWICGRLVMGRLGGLALLLFVVEAMLGRGGDGEVVVC